MDDHGLNFYNQTVEYSNVYTTLHLQFKTEHLLFSYLSLLPSRPP